MFNVTTRSILSALLLLAAVLECSSASDRFPFVIPGYDATHSATDFSYLSPAAAGEDGFVRIVDGHFATESGRLRIWGVNFCFAANFPTHDQAEKVAAHLAKLGINGVRIHHHDTQFAPRGLLRPDGTFDREQVDRLDFLLAELHRHGIYVNLNMHVGRSVSRQLGWPEIGKQHYLTRDKHALHFQPEIQQAYWSFCREYLQHVNPYRKLRRADDPGIAMIELCNENKFSEAGPSALLSAPDPYRSAITHRWNTWLKEKYVDSDRLRRAWTDGETMEERVLAESRRWKPGNVGDWNLSDNKGKAPIKITVRTESSDTIVRLAPEVKAAQGWHQQFSSPQVDLFEHTTYQLVFRARSDSPRHLSMNVATTRSGKWESLGLTEGVELSKDWKTFRYRFQPPRDERGGARLAFDLGGDQAAVEITDLRWIQGGSSVALPEGQLLERLNVALPGFNASDQSQSDFNQFMVDTETDFYRQTIRLLKKEIGIRVPITTTQANYQPIQILDELADYTDIHAYWHHPVFPGKPWDSKNWLVQSESLVPFPFQDKWPRVNLLMRSSWRINGKPFTFSEWNVGEPSFFAADAIPVAAVTASLQDWDAVFFFTYQSGGDEWNTDKLLGFFEFNGQPVKLALVAALANLYRRADLPALSRSVAVSPSRRDGLGAVALRYKVGMDPALDEGKSFEPPTAQQLSTAEHRLIRSADEQLLWDARNPQDSYVLINTPQTRVAWGFVGGKSLQLGSWQLKFGEIERNYAVAIATSHDGKPLEQSESILLTLVGNAENRDMGWNADRTSVGTDWGEAPTMVNGISVDLTLPIAHPALQVYALTPRGARAQEVRFETGSDGSQTFRLGPKYRTLFYELSRK